MSLFFFSPHHKRFTGPCIRFFFLIGDCADNTAIGCGCGDQCSNELMIPSMAYLCVKEKEKNGAESVKRYTGFDLGFAQSAADHLTIKSDAWDCFLHLVGMERVSDLRREYDDS